MQESDGLKAHALESFINDYTKRKDIFTYENVLNHGQIQTVAPQYLKLLNLFAYGSYKHYLEMKDNNDQLLQKCPLNEQQITHLKALSLLTLFQGMLEVTIQRAMSQLNMKINQQNKKQFFKLIIQMSIDSLVKVKIDQCKGVIIIYQSKVRDIKQVKDGQFIGQGTQFDLGAVRSNLLRIIQKNQGVMRQITKLKDKCK